MPSIENTARAYISSGYTKTELQALLKAALAKAADPDIITAASTGSGTSYARAQRKDPDLVVEALQLAIWLLDHPGETPPESGQQSSPVWIARV